ncbi:site-specific DNA-methyltransferase [Methylotenera sp.]|uniref:site-specific DNA-methyltransferase n=1 Tax=Methylotenera sp. TaxID=2051956 RepID=UPI0027305333|nr:site-specific DNA-methyltransferase [Methylotenera sp.]MDP1959026.1 site-specific DNA-methyltransferase [Methylotenera sp.]MDP2230345.1 site-specific DNA-methyltransferase [Methylotenera sp.]
MPTLNWIGKDAVVKHHKEVPFRMLQPVAELSYGEAINPENENLIVQGDNLHALKALLPRYAGQVKCIYIDPPYNTGNEGWVYNDNVNSPEITRWLGEVVGKEGETLDRHDRWLCMMYPRLLLLKQFLSDDGAIFVSIDDDEVHHLRLLMDEIFGANKRLASFVWRTDGNFDNQAKIKNCHEYFFAYSKYPERFIQPKVVDPSTSETSKLNKPFIRNTIIKNGPKNPVSSVTLPIGFPADFEVGTIPARTNAWPHYSLDLIVKDASLTNQVDASTGWSSKDLLIEFIKAGFQPIKDSKNQTTRFVLTKTGAIEAIKDREQASHVISVVGGVGSTQSQSVELAEMGFKFSFPKPVDLIKYIISMIDDKNCLVLDSFAGSGTTAHATLKLNDEDGGNRNFILVEMDENIAQNVTAKRVNLVANGYSKDNGEAVAGLGGSFKFCKLSQEPLFTAEGQIRSDVTFAELAEFVWFTETGTGYPKGLKPSPLLGVYQGKAVYLLFNGILKDRGDLGGNVLNNRTLSVLPAHEGQRVVYGARTRFDKAKLSRMNIEFKQLPYELTVKSWV